MTVTPGRSIQSFVLTLSLAISAACVAHAGSISTNDPPVAALADGRTGTIAFEALTPKSSRDLVLRKPTEKSVIAGVLTDDAQAAARDGPLLKVFGSANTGPQAHQRAHAHDKKDQAHGYDGRSHFVILDSVSFRSNLPGRGKGC